MQLWLRVAIAIVGLSVVAAYLPIPEDDRTAPVDGAYQEEGPTIQLAAVGPAANRNLLLASPVSKPEINRAGAEAESQDAGTLPPNWVEEPLETSLLPPDTANSKPEPPVVQEDFEGDIPMAIPVPDPSPNVIEVPPLKLAKRRKAELRRKAEARDRERRRTLPNTDLAEAMTAARRAVIRVGYRFPSRKAGKIAVIDFTKPSYLKRMGIFDLTDRRSTKEPVSKHLVAHGMRSGAAMAQKFSNKHGSHMSSPGLYRVGKIYSGKHGASIRLHGLEKGLNDNAAQRGIVLHSAKYVTYGTIVQNIMEAEGPRIGRSHGCPAVSPADMKYIREQLVPGSLLYIYVEKAK